MGHVGGGELLTTEKTEKCAATVRKLEDDEFHGDKSGMDRKISYYLTLHVYSKEGRLREIPSGMGLLGPGEGQGMKEMLKRHKFQLQRRNTFKNSIAGGSRMPLFPPLQACWPEWQKAHGGLWMWA